MCSIPTGHPSSHQPQVVQPQMTSSVATSVIMSSAAIRGLPLAAAASAADSTTAVWFAAAPLRLAASNAGAFAIKCSLCWITRYFGLSALLVLTVGQLSVQRPHSRHADI